MAIATIVKNRVNPYLLRWLGVAPAPRTRFLAGQRRCLFEALSIDSVIDVGANVGQYGVELRRAGYSGAINSFEPMTEAFADLKKLSDKDPAWSVHNVALGDINSDMTLHAWSGSAGESSSLRTVSPALEARLGRPRDEVVRVTTLDSWYAEAGSPDLGRSWLKIDTQGYEMPVLVGAGECLASIAGIEIELPFRQWYHDMAGMCDLLNFLKEAGFTPASEVFFVTA